MNLPLVLLGVLVALVAAAHVALGVLAPADAAVYGGISGAYGLAAVAALVAGRVAR